MHSKCLKCACRDNIHNCLESGCELNQTAPALALKKEMEKKNEKDAVPHCADCSNFVRRLP